MAERETRRHHAEGLYELLDRARSLEGAARRRFLEGIEEPALRSALEEILQGGEVPSGFLSEPVMQLGELFVDPELGPRRTPLRPGDRLGEFEIVEFVAGGGGGEVYTARQMSLGGRRVALKVVSGVDSACRRRFEREASIAADIHHPNLIEVYAFGYESRSGCAYYAMRLVDGPSLAQVILRGGRPTGRADVRRIVRIAREVADALAALHEAGLVHGDVKPANILLDRGTASERATAPDAAVQADPLDAPAVLVDLGLVRRQGLVPSAPLGTLGYAAPEVVAGAAADPRSDVYALGRCVVDALCGGATRGVGGSTGVPSVEEAARTPGVDTDLAAVLRRATDPEPRWRYESSRAFGEELRRWERGEPVSARRLPWIERIRRWGLRNSQRLLVWGGRAIVFALLVLVLAAGLDLMRLMGDARRLDSMFAEGRFEACARLARDLPRSFLRAILPERAYESVLGLRDLSGDAPETEVLGALERSSWNAAALAAARHVERDGARAHPALLAFLLRGLEGGAERRTEALSLLARIFYERPDLSPADLEASRPARRSLRQVLAEATGEEELRILTALAGCGTPRDVRLLLERSRATFVPTGEGDARERARLALFAAQWITRRATACGIAERYPAEVPRAWTEDISRWFGESLGGYDRGALLAGTLDRWLAADAFLRRHLDEAVPRRSPTEARGRDWTWSRAAREDPRLFEVLIGGPTPSANGPLYALEEWVELVASYDELPWERLEANLRTWARTVGIDPDTAVGKLREGVPAHRERRTTLNPLFLPDADTHLGAGDPGSPEDAEPLHVPADELRARFPPVAGLERWRAAAWVDFTLADVRAAGGGVDVELRGAGLRRDPYREGCGTVRLGSAGRSAVAISFPTGGADQKGTVVLQLQKANREGLPYMGSAWIELSLDGRSIASLRVGYGSPELALVPFPIPPAPAGTRRELLIRLDDRSDTTLWIHRIAVLCDQGTNPWR